MPQHHTTDAMHDNTPLLQITDVSRSFTLRQKLFDAAADTVKAVDSVTLHISRGETLGLVGESGCGKSTLARMTAGLLKPDSGTVHITPDSGGSGRIANASGVQMIFQDPFSSLNPRMRVGRSIGEALEVQGMPRAARRARVEHLLAVVGLAPEHYDRYPHEFSGGQRQRIAIARALAPQASLLVCDEPVSALDVSVQAQVLNLLADLRDSLGLSMLFISHDLSVVRHFCHRVAVMYLGRIIETAPRDMIYNAPLHPYTKALLASLPVPDPDARTTHTRLQGEPPSPVSPPSGCHFHPRCPHAMPHCRTHIPAETVLNGRHRVRCHLYA
ncbi:ABC transporter ATP-binding protein [Oleidesulfovibrio alaskensis]|jgi:oligopeptide/dipeptide ABC transporter ATP-binding protein|uniref:ABC transporter ATP-binding protein n=1 Tax=Oleidesulfovibrio alaskensis TaxID=58180 RepID=UPI001A5ABAF4|nr:oligopeptide/dipeptide ABC transporter ATP-binding protein [Oleidesulfovibrio alaskensis]MBL3583450.1 ATP-binding cassette domain-containing protein [Oleidesulfovibrio alaskensis]